MRDRGESLCVDKFMILWKPSEFLNSAGGSRYAWISWFKQGLLWITSPAAVSG